MFPRKRFQSVIPGALSLVRDFLCLALVGPTCPSGPGTPDFNMIQVLFEGTYDNERIYTCECLYEFDLLI